MSYALVGYFAFMETVLGPVMPFLRAELGLGYAAASTHFSAFAVGGIVLGCTGRRVVRRWDGRTRLWGGAAGMAAGALLLAVSPSAPGTVAGAFFMGLCGTVLLTATQAHLSGRHGPWAAVALTESNVVASTCAVTAPVLVGVCASWGPGWRAALAPPTVALALLAARFSRGPFGPRAHPPEPPTGAPSPLPARYWGFFGVVFLGVSAEWSVAYWGADFLHTATGLGRSDAATALGVFLAAMLAGRLLGSRLAASLSGPWLLACALSVALAGFPVCWLAAAPPTALLGLFVTGLGIACVYPLGVAAALAAAPTTADAAAARLAVAGGGAVLVAPLSVGAVADTLGIEAAYGLVIPMLATALLLIALTARGG